MVYNTQENKDMEKFTTNSTNSVSSTVMSIFHILMVCFACYLSFKCNGRFDLVAFLIAFCCPYCYILFALAYGCNSR